MSRFLQNSVGLDGANYRDDAWYVQLLLLRKLPGLRLKPDGRVGADTTRAIYAFQKQIRLFQQDGRIDPSRETLRRLEQGLSQADLSQLRETANRSVSHVRWVTKPPLGRGADPLNEATVEACQARGKVVIDSGAVGKLIFPIDYAPASFHREDGGARYFGAGRGERKHAACDLLSSVTEKDRSMVAVPVYAMAKGKVRAVSTTYANGKKYGKQPDIGAIEVVHEDVGLIVRYGEVSNHKSVKRIERGATVEQGEIIGFLGLFLSGSSMLHLELYCDPSSQKPLSEHTRPFRRRKDLADPTLVLDGLLQERKLPARDQAAVDALLRAGVFDRPS